MPTEPTHKNPDPIAPGAATGDYSPTDADGNFSLAPAPPTDEATDPGGPSENVQPSQSTPSRWVLRAGGQPTEPSVSARPARPPIDGTADLPPADPADTPIGGGTSAYQPDAPTDASRGGDAGLAAGQRQNASDTFDHSDLAPEPGRLALDGPRYKMRKVHARGGMGEVWEAEDAGIGRVVALKKMRKQIKGKEDQFFWEGQITGQLEHPGVVPVHELGIDPAGEPYYVMKFVHGKTLLQEIEGFHAAPPGRPTREVERLRLLQVFQAVCQTVAYAHSRGVIHRDIKPENVMIGEYGESLVLDWGLAKLVGQDEHAETARPVRRQSYSGETFETLAGSIKGTPRYMAPESAAGNIDAVDQVSDVFLLGATLYHLLTGKYPRQGKTLPELIAAAHQPPVPPRTIDPTVPRPLEAICLKAMAIDRAGRYPTAKALADDLQQYLAGEPVTAYRESFPERAWRWARRHRLAIYRVLTAVFVLGLAGFGYAKYREFKDENERKLREAAAEQQRIEDERDEADRKAKELARRQQAAADLKRYRRLAEEMRFLAANTHPAGPKEPYFNPKAGFAKGQEAVALTQPWGPRLEGFVLDTERPALAEDLYDLLSWMAQLRIQAGGPEAGPEALALLDRAAMLRPPTRSYHRLRGQALTAVGRAADATSEAKAADDPAAPLTAADHFLLGEQARLPATRPDNLQDRNGAFTLEKPAMEKALAEYRLAQRADPGHYWANYQLGRSLLSLGRRDEGLGALGACIALKPDSPWGYIARGSTLIVLTRYDEAAAELDKAAALDPDSRLHRLPRGLLESLRGNTDAALAEYDAVLAPPADRQRPEAAFQKALILARLGKTDEALVAADRALAGKVPVRVAYLLRAQIQLQQGKDAEGVDDLNSFFVASDPGFDRKSPAAAGKRGRQLRLLAQEFPPGQDRQRARVLRLARAELQDAINRGGGTVAVHEDLGRVSELVGRPADAIQAYSQALEKVPADKGPAEDRVRLLVTRGWAYQTLRPEEMGKARADFEAALKLAPENAEAHTGLGYVEACRKADARARREAEMAVLYGSGDFLILHNVACVFAKLSEADPGRKAEFEDLALDYLRRAVELWNRDRTGPNELVQIRNEPAFTRSLRNRPEFKQLLAE